MIKSLIPLIFLWSSNPVGRELPDTLTQTKDYPNKFENQGMYHSTYLILENDSSFVYYSVFEVGFDLAFGEYTSTNDTLTFNWDQQQTLNAVTDSSIYQKYFKYSTPRPYKVENVRFIRTDKKLKRIE